MAAQLNISEIHLARYGDEPGDRLVTPPVASPYVACGLGNVSVKEISKAMVPFLIAAVIVLLLVTYIPIISMWLPGMIKLSAG